MKERLCFVYKGIVCFALCVLFVTMVLFLCGIGSMAMVELVATCFCFIIFFGIVTGMIMSIM